MENSTITGAYKTFAENYRVKGSVGSELLRDLNYHFTKAKIQLDSLRSIRNSDKMTPPIHQEIKIGKLNLMGL